MISVNSFIRKTSYGLVGIGLLASFLWLLVHLQEHLWKLEDNKRET